MDEYKLIKKCQDGNKDAFNELISIYYPFIFKFLFKLTGKKDITEDIVQDTFIKMIRNIDKYDKSYSSFGTYLITIAKNTYIDYLRKQKCVFQEFDIDMFGDSFYNDNLYNNLSYQDLLKQIDELPEVQCEVIKLKYLEGYTLSEIADMQVSSVKTIKSRLFEARKKLRRLIKGDEI